MKLKTMFVAFWFVGLALHSCGTSKQVTEISETPEEATGLSQVTFDVVSNNALYGGGEEKIEKGTQIINSENEWSELKDQMNSINNVSDGFKIQSINFDRQTVIACFDEVRPSGGFSIGVKLITESADRITVYTEFTSPTMSAISVLTQPYIIVVIDKTELPIITE